MTPAGALPDGRVVQTIDIASGGYQARILDYGARLAVFRRVGRENVAVSPGDLADYLGDARYAGPVIGPVINRIAEAEAEIGGRLYRFDANQDGRHTLHCGANGTHDAVWDIVDTGAAAVRLHVALADGEGGFPGNRTITARYTLDEGGLILDIEATTDAPTLMNPGLHGVWTIGRRSAPAAMKLMIPSQKYLPVTEDVLPTGEVADVAGTVFDHRAARTPHPGLDHNYCFEPEFGLRARLTGPGDEVLEIYSDAPGLQAYAGGAVGIALEPQLWPDAAHNPGFPSILLEPGETFRQHSRFAILRA